MKITANSGRLFARNSVLNLVGQFVPLVVGFVTVPYIISGLGQSRFAILSLVWAIMLYLAVFDLGLGRATTKFLAGAIAQDDISKQRELVWSALVAQSILGLLAALVLAGASGLLVERLLRVPAALQSETVTAFLLLAPAGPLLLATITLRGALEAGQRFDLVNVVRVPLSASNFLLPLVSVGMGWGLIGTVALLVLAHALAAGIYYELSVRVFPAFRGIPRFSYHSFRKLLGYGGWITISDIVGPILVYIDRFFLGAVVAVGTVAYYTAPFDIVTRIWIIPASLLATLFPAFAALNVLNRSSAIQVLVARAIKYLLLAVGGTVVLIVAYAEEVLRLWLGGRFAAESATVLAILAIAVLVNSLAYVLYSAVQAAGRPDITAKFHLAELPFYLLILWFLIGSWETEGAAVAWLIRVTADGVLLFAAASHVSSISRDSLLREEVPKALLSLTVFGCAVGVISLSYSSVWIRLWLTVLALLVFALVVWRALMSERDRIEFAASLGGGRWRGSKTIKE